VIKAVIFDFDGVLIESTGIKTAAFARIFKGESAPDRERIMRYHLSNAGISRFEKFRYIYRGILKKRLTQAKLKVLCAEFSLLVKEAVIAAPFVAGASGFLERNYRKLGLFVVSATPHNEIAEIIKRKNLSFYFREIYGAPMHKGAAVRKIMADYSLAPEEIVYVGDALSDYRAARENSIVFIARIKDNQELFSKIECIKLKDLSGLQGAINRMRNG
jgi:phosphoglycolate phosphatase-like HAD superfamily hydrolase